MWDRRLEIACLPSLLLLEELQARGAAPLHEEDAGAGETQLECDMCVREGGVVVGGEVGGSGEVSGHGWGGVGLGSGCGWGWGGDRDD